MKRTLATLMLVATFGFASLDADAQARRFGGGRNIGKQRPAPMEAQKAPAAAPAAPPASQSAAPAKPGAPAAAPAPAAKPSFMQRWGGLLAGLGIGALLASMFGAQMGPIIGMLLMAALGFVVVMLLFRLFSRRTPGTPAVAAAAPGSARTEFRGIGSAIPGAEAPAPASATATNPSSRGSNIDPQAIPPEQLDAFLRVAKTSFIRLQAANDAGDLDDIRDYTTPEMYAELSMQLQERGGVAQRTEVMNLHAQMVEAVVEGDYAIASVRFTGLTRENNAANPSPFDEIWHVRKSQRERNAPWLVAGIQQVE